MGTPAQQLAEALDARHKLATGQLARLCDRLAPLLVALDDALHLLRRHPCEGGRRIVLVRHRVLAPTLGGGQECRRKKR